MITIMLHPIDGGITYDVSCNGEMLAMDVIEPVSAAAWVLHDRGLEGPFQMVGPTGRLRMTFPSIAAAAANSRRKAPPPLKVAFKSKKGTGVAQKKITQNGTI